ncbi:hypothetical protein KX729_26535 [Rhizobium sp. XQZ8]|uniref:hypothetical protein n=1 Tax=Rhizobium populisoli TaxID=2859785 RepID=UPI001CA4DDA1|nr:hypothetical protein [Rhizobium populisoli]MBW6425004.1 hypothetical protein [Rhizobium populisoli]
MVESGSRAGKAPLSSELVQDCGGFIRQIALSIPEAFFDEASTGGWFRPLVPIGNLIVSLPSDIEVLLLVDDAVLPKAKAWAHGLQARCRIAFVPVPAGSIGSPWIQDAFLVRTGEETDFEILSSEGSGLAACIAGFLQVPLYSLPVLPPGGNQLVGQDFRLIGRSEIRSRYQGASPPATTVAGAVKALEELDRRPVSIFGYRAEDLLQAQRPSVPRKILRTDAAEIEGGGIRSTGSESLLHGGHQFGFHVDQFVSVTGLKRNDRPLLLVGDPTTAGEPETPLIENARRCLDASAAALVLRGFEVMRNPVPYALAPDSGKRLPRLYNNLILENQVRSGRERPLAWLAQFGDVEPSLQAFDRNNIEIWGALGFEVLPVYGWSYFASRNGALRCISKILQRSKVLV